MPAKKSLEDTVTAGSIRKILFRSFAYAIFAYFITFFFEKTLIIGGAILSGYSFELSYYQLKVDAGFKSWDQEAVLLIYFIPYLIQAIVLIALYIRLNNMELKPKYSRIFMLWIMLFLLYRLLGLFPAQILFKTGIYYVIDWLYIGLVFKIFGGVITVVIFFFSGFKIFKAIIALSGTYHDHISDMGIPALLKASVLFPVFGVCLIALIYFLPGLPVEEISGLVLIIALGVYVFIKLFGIDPDFFSFKEQLEAKSKPVWLVTYAAISILAIRTILGFVHLAG